MIYLPCAWEKDLRISCRKQLVYGKEIAPSIEGAFTAQNNKDLFSDFILQRIQPMHSWLIFSPAYQIT